MTAVTNDGQAAIHCAARMGQNAVVVALLEQKCEVSMVNTVSRWTPLMFAAYGGHVEVVQTLLYRRADADMLDNAGRTPLLYAIRAEDEESVDLLAPLTTKMLGQSLVTLAMSALEITPGIRSFIAKCGEESEVFIDGVRAATHFGNLPLVQTLLSVGDKNWLSADTLSVLTEMAVMTDNKDICETILSLCGEQRHSISQRWVHLASERGNVNIQKLLDPQYPDQVEEKKGKLRDAVNENKANLLDLVPKSEDFPYSNAMDKITCLLDANYSVQFEELLATLHVPEVHYKCKDAAKCLSDCPQKEKCARIRETDQLVNHIMGKLGEMHPIFKDIKGAVVGSLKEKTRTFEVDEVDINLSFPENIAKPLLFNQNSQAIEFKQSNNQETQPEEVLLPYKKENNELDSRMIFRHFVSGFLKIIQDMELPTHLTMDPLTTSYTPCLSCMKTDMVDPECKRCRHKASCLAHNETCGCKEFTSPSLTHTKIGIALHLQWTMPDGSKANVDCDVNCPNLSLDTPYDGDIEEIRYYLSTARPIAWLEEYRKLEDMGAARGQPHVTRSVRLRLINRHTVLARQALLFLGDHTLLGRRQDVYILLKILKTCTASKATSYRVKFAVNEMLRGVDPDQVGMGQAVRRVMSYRTIKNKFGSIHRDLEKTYTGVKVTDTGFQFLRKPQDLNDEDIAKEEDETVDDGESPDDEDEDETVNDGESPNDEDEDETVDDGESPDEEAEATKCCKCQ